MLPAKQHGPPGPVSLRLVERVVGVFENQIGRGRVIRIDGEADRCGNQDADAVQHIRRRDFLADPFAEVEQPGLFSIRDDDGVFVAAQSGKEGVAWTGALQPAPDLDQQAVSRGMTIEIVDRTSVPTDR